MLAGASGAYRLAQALPSIQVPATVQAVLAARIDRLPPEGETAPARPRPSLGRKWPGRSSRPWRSRRRRCSPPGTQPSAGRRVPLRGNALFPEHAYTFKHALTQQVAYETLLQERRRAHARIVGAIEALYGDRLAEYVEQLAHHAVEERGAGEGGALSAAGRHRAAARSALPDARGWFEQAQGSSRRCRRACPRWSTPSRSALSCGGCRSAIVRIVRFVSRLRRSFSAGSLAIGPLLTLCFRTGSPRSCPFLKSEAAKSPCVIGASTAVCRVPPVASGAEKERSGKYSERH